MTRSAVHRLGIALVFFSALYWLSDLIEAVQGGFSDWQLVITLIAEAAIPFMVIGVYLVQRPRIGLLGLVSSIGYAYAFVFFTGTVVYALVDGTPDYDTMVDQIGVAMTLHGAIMVLAGIGLGIAVTRAGVLPAWTGVMLGLGVVAVAATQGAGEVIGLVAAGIRDLAFAGMGLAVLTSVDS
ncbi:MAG: hypothetical protein KDB54_11885 [Solirubrobacterales bacterium]|nr:hypothetical protein [Solirubrobacterales bacterium]HRV59643.1 hypothetical protein [Solirubrobacterales bacterium]